MNADWAEIFQAIWQGSYWYFTVVAVFAMAVRIVRKQWTWAESLIVCGILLHLILQIVQIYAEKRTLFLAKRYILPCAPLFFGWTAWAFCAVYSRVEKHLGKRRIQFVVIPLIVFHCGVLIFDGIYPTVKTYRISSSKGVHKRHLQTLIPMIREDYKGTAFYPVEQRLLNYYSDKRPFIRSDYPLTGYFCGGTDIYTKWDEQFYPFLDYIIRTESEPAPEGFTLKFSYKDRDETLHIYGRNEQQ